MSEPRDVRGELRRVRLHGVVLLGRATALELFARPAGSPPRFVSTTTAALVALFGLDGLEELVGVSLEFLACGTGKPLGERRRKLLVRRDAEPQRVRFRASSSFAALALSSS
jgi:hypothetical protein